MSTAAAAAATATETDNYIIFAYCIGSVCASWLQVAVKSHMEPTMGTSTVKKNLHNKRDEQLL